MRIHIDTDRCEGHGRCYSLAPGLIQPDEMGDGREIGDGTVPPEQEAAARKAVANCPEHAVVLDEGA
jgi:ferredoxin